MHSQKTTLALFLALSAFSGGLLADPKENASPDKDDPPTGLKFTGLPLVSYSTDDGFGYGLRVYGTHYEEGYAPFRYQAFGQYYRTTRGYEYHEAMLDALGFLGTPFRVRFDAGLERYLNAQYYGYSNVQDIQREKRIKTGETPLASNVAPARDLLQLNDDITLNTNVLTNPSAPPSSLLNPSRNDLRARQDKFYNYDSIKPFFSATSEDFFGKSHFKWFTGLRLQRYRVQSYQGDKEKGQAYVNDATLIDIEKPTGYNATEAPRFVNGVRLGLAYDSRPVVRELNPNAGVFTDLHYEGVGKGTGSHYTFNRYTLTWRQYIELFPNLLNPSGRELVFAYRFLTQYTEGDAPFFEMGRIYTMRESALGLGGNGGIRGYPANQFVDRIMSVVNTELRLTTGHTAALGGIDFVLLGYYDVGRVAHTWEELQARDLHRAAGGGIRLVWQRNTIINISAGRSGYESNANFSFNHMF